MWDAYNGGGVWVKVAWTDDGATPADTNGDGEPDTHCGDSVNVKIFDTAYETDWLFGMAETGVENGWFGEDCYLGQDSWNACHSVGLDTTLLQASDCRVESVADGTTILDASRQHRLTYFLQDTRGFCFVWGDDIEYYEPLECVHLYL